MDLHLRNLGYLEPFRVVVEPKCNIILNFL